MSSTPQDEPGPVDDTGARPTVPRHDTPAPDVHDTGVIPRTRAASTWVGLVVGIVVAVLLLVFILQNLDSVTFELFVWEFTLPAGISLLLAAIAGAVIMALAGGVRIFQIRRVAKRAGSRPAR
ncbi:lipopolysaccharide assembly LapA domain-containing protein [Prescottella sp. R16]|uniref:LapA family protein n=1 Tax=Prescottella sp. R16 TaxID=3064529 RepID=UPI00272DF7A1|nr:lipopolysaccharide assembly protein LapA domain-containing protein [Prescottella sp. R16]